MLANKTNYSITNNDNYKQNIIYSIEIILDKYINIIIDYFKHLEDNNFNINNKYYKYIIVNGINCINNIFKILLLYTNNLELVIYHTQKSFVYYIEFITQITDENNNFLQLNSKDASLFVYKKTIFEINNDLRKEFTIKKNNKELFVNINNYILLIKKIIQDYININSNNLYKDIQNHIFPIFKKLIEILYINDSKQNLINDKIKAIEMFCNKNSENNNNDNYINNINNIIKKIKKKSFSISSINL